MKKLSLILLFSMVCFLAKAQTVEMTYHFSQPNISHLEGYDMVQFNGCMQSALAGQPSLPWHSVSLMLPQGTEAESIEVELSDFVTLEGTYNLFPYQPARTYSDPERREFLKDESIYASKSVYPSQAYGKISTHYMNGVGFAFSAISPVQYNPAEGKVMYATKAEVKVKTVASKADNSSKLWLNGSNVNRIKSLAQNPEMLQNYDARGRNRSNYELLVITKNQWVEQFDTYQSFYAARGLRTQVVAVEDIYSTMEGRDNPEKIRNFIIQEYENNGIIMVNLAGDVPDIPYRGFYCSVLTGGSYNTDADIPADLYYAALDGTWNDNNDNKWGEIGEDDLLPELGIARMCFKTQGELDNILHKTFTYQESPVLGEFRKVTMGGEHLYDDPVSNGSQYLEMLVGEHSDNGYTTICIPEDYNYTRLYYENGTWSGNRLIEAINAGTQYVHHDGHANTNYVAEWYNSTITDQNFSGANGVDHNYTFFHTSGCICGDFTDNCILEKMTIISNFAVATFGNSRYGWFNEGQTEGPAIHLHRETEDAYYHERIPYAGLAMTEGKCQTAPWVNAPGQWEENALRWNFYDLNIMGDVAVCPWHDEPFNPDVNYATELMVGSASTDVTVSDENGNPLFNFRCSLFNNDELLGSANTDENGVAHIQFANPIDFVGELNLIVTGCDAWPQTLSIRTLPGNCAYVIFDAYEINNESGMAEYGQNVGMNMSFKNVGTVTAGNVTATISTDSDYVTITNATTTFSNIAGSQTIEIENAFSMSISDSVPDQMLTQFIVTCTDGTDVWESKFNLRIAAPALTITEVVVDDSEGNGNGVAEPGETITLHIMGSNIGHSTSPFASMHILPPDQVQVSQQSFNLDAIEANGEFTADVTFTLDEDTPEGIAYNFIITVTAGNYECEYQHAIAIGNVVEDWETGDFSKFDWVHNNYNNWYIVDENPYEGTYCARSGNISDSQNTSLSLTIDLFQEGEVSFYKRVSSESSYDKLYFYIDGVEKGNWSGEVAWSKESYTLTPGQHELKWAYSKDGSVSNGEDCAWIDYISFPPTEIITEISETTLNEMAIYPNPSHGSFSINLPEEHCQVVIYNNMGQVIYQSEGSGLSEFSINGLGNGVYFVNVKSSQSNTTQKLIVK